MAQQPQVGFVQHVHHPDQAGADLRGQADALRFAAGQGVGLAFEGEVVEPDIDQEAEPLADFLDDLGRDFAAPAGQRQAAEESQRFVDRQHHQFRQGTVGDEDIARGPVQTRTAAVGTGLFADVLGQLLAHRGRLGFAIAAFQVRHDAFELVLALAASARIGEVVEGDQFVAAAVQHGLAHVVRQRLPGRVHVELVMPGQRGDQLEVVGVAPVPAAHGAGRKRQLGMDDHARRIEELGHAQAVALRAGADRRVEREQARFQFRQRVIADRAAVFGRKQQRRSIGMVQRLHRGHAIAQFQGGLETFGQALLDVLARLEAVDHRLDGVFLAQGQGRHRVDFMQLAIDAHAHVALRAQLVEDLGVLALALADHRRQHHVALFAIEGEYLVDHLADRLRFQRVAVVGAARQAHAGVQQAQVVVDLGDGADGGAGVVRGRFLLDRDRRRQPLDVVDIGLLHHAEELARIGRQRFHIAPLAFGINRVEGQGRLAGAGQAGDHDQLVSRQVEIDVLEVVRPRAANADEVHGHRVGIRGANKEA